MPSWGDQNSDLTNTILPGTNMDTSNRPFYVDGFPSLSAFIASDRDGTSAIFTRFNRLAARNLLLLQSELAELQAKLDAFDSEDRDDMENLQSMRNWTDYKSSHGPDSDRMILIGQMRSTMKEYSMSVDPAQPIRPNSHAQEKRSCLRARSLLYRLQKTRP